jgi:hypothetical protein
MDAVFTPPLTRIGEADWVSKLQTYLQDLDIESQGESGTRIEATEARLGIKLPAEIKQYYLHFGTTSSSDFMYNLKRVADLQWLADADWEFIQLYFEPAALSSMIVFSETPGNDPVCFDVLTGGIYLFSHDPIKKAPVFDTFSQYLLFELLEAEQLIGDSNLSESAKKDLKDKYLSGENLDYHYRDMKL